VLQAMIAAAQAEEQVDWSRIASLYGELARLTHSPVVELNRAVAVAQAGSPQAALAITEGLPLRDYHYLHSTRAELLRRLGRTQEARAAYQRALELATAEPELRFLRRRLAGL
jgi:RNA polymerase sigma-70 factor (ECF subfamily)